jgi:hypothetical protein
MELNIRGSMTLMAEDVEMVYLNGLTEINILEDLRIITFMVRVNLFGLMGGFIKAVGDTINSMV